MLGIEDSLGSDGGCRQVDRVLPRKDDGYTMWQAQVGCQGGSEEGLTLSELGSKQGFLEEVKSDWTLMEENPVMWYRMENVPGETEETLTKGQISSKSSSTDMELSLDSSPWEQESIPRGD